MLSFSSQIIELKQSKFIQHEIINFCLQLIMFFAQSYQHKSVAKDKKKITLYLLYSNSISSIPALLLSCVPYVCMHKGVKLSVYLNCSWIWGESHLWTFRGLVSQPVKDEISLRLFRFFPQVFFQMKIPAGNTRRRGAKERKSSSFSPQQHAEEESDLSRTINWLIKTMPWNEVLSPQMKNDSGKGKNLKTRFRQTKGSS